MNADGLRAARLRRWPLFTDASTRKINGGGNARGKLQPVPLQEPRGSPHERRMNEQVDELKPERRAGHRQAPRGAQAETKRSVPMPFLLTL